MRSARWSASRNCAAALSTQSLTRHRGRLIRTLGDGLLIDFSSAVDAVTFAVSIQAALSDHNRDVSPEKQIVLRIGINVGDIVVEDDNILGDGVNIATRLEASCEPGGVLISRAVRDQIRDKLQYPFADLGEREVKNIARPVRVFGLSAAEIAALACQGDQASPERVITAAPAIAPSAEPFSIVVLPFHKQSGDREQEYFADGLTESLTAELATRMPELSVVSSTSAFTYKGKPTDVRQIGRDLDVRYVLEGSVLLGPGAVRINAQLVNAISGAHLWAERFEGDRSDHLRLQDRLAFQIAKTVSARFVADAARDAERRADNPRARDLYVRASAAWLYVPVLLPHLQQAEKLLRQAVTLDGSRPELFGTLAISIVVQIYDWSHQLQLTPDQEQARLAEAEVFIDRALALDFSHPQAHYARGLLLGRGGGRWREAAQALKIAVNLRPDSAGFKLGYAQALGHLGEPEKGVELIEEALRFSPRDPNLASMHYNLGVLRLQLGDFDQAVGSFLQSRAIRPSFLRVHVNLAIAYAYLDRLDEASLCLVEARRVDPHLKLLSRKTLDGGPPIASNYIYEGFLKLERIEIGV